MSNRQKIDDPITVFAALRPAGLDRTAQQAFTRRRNVDLSRALSDPAPMGRRARQESRRPWTSVRFGVATAAAAALVVGGAAGISLSQQSHPSTAARHNTPTVMTAQSFLLASAARTTSPAGNGIYWHSVERLSEEKLGGSTSGAKKPDDFHAYVATTTQTWAGKNGRFHAVTGLDPSVTFPTAADQAAWKAAGSPPMSVVQHDDDSTALRFSVGGKFLTLSQLQALPADPNGLRNWLNGDWRADNAGVDEDTFVWATALDLLTTPTTAGTRAALYQTLAQLPGIRIAGTVSDPLGRSGIAIDRSESTGTGGQDVRRLVIDGANGMLLADLVYPGTSGTSAPLFWDAWQSLGWTNEIGN